MNIVTPNTTGSISFAVRTRPSQSFSPFVVRMNWVQMKSLMYPVVKLLLHPTIQMIF
jgi:hypothetical protein